MKAFRSRIFHYLNRNKFEYFEDGLLIIKNGLVDKLGPYQDVIKLLDPQVEIVDERDKILMPGFIDAHVHAVQTKVIASYGADLLDWLNKYTFPEESRFDDEEYTHKQIDFFYKQLLKNGTTTAAIYPSVHEASLAALADEAINLNMRVLAGKTHMDRNAPKHLCEITENTFQSSYNLIKRYDGKLRFNYVLTPRFAITSSSSQLEELQKLKMEFPAIRIQTHISENDGEIESTMKLFPERKNYLDVYDYYSLIDDKSLLGHSIHFSEDEWNRVKEKGASLVHCPTSNLFLGSGLFDLKKAWESNIPVALGSDVGGGTSFSMLKTAAAAYQVATLRGYKPTALQLFYLLSLGGAKALNLDHKIGNFEQGKEGDFVLLNPANIEILANRLIGVKDIEEMLFAMLFLGDERIVDSVYLMGKYQNL